MTAEKGRPLPPRWAARFNTRGWRRDLDAETFNYAVACQCAVTIEYDVNTAERQPRVSFAFLRLKGFLKHLQFSKKHGCGQAAPGIKGQRTLSIDVGTLSGLPHARAG